nr:hypothetical protein CFP56_19385 [Quercus suber]
MDCTVLVDLCGPKAVMRTKVQNKKPGNHARRNVIDESACRACACTVPCCTASALPISTRPVADSRSRSSAERAGQICPAQQGSSRDCQAQIFTFFGSIRCTVLDAHVLGLEFTTVLLDQSGCGDDILAA